MSCWTVAITWLIILQTCSVCGQNVMKSSLAIVLDSSGSMNPEISQFNDNVDRMFFNSMRNSPIENFVLVTFGDPNAQLLTVTHDREEFKKYSTDITAVAGNADCPEYTLKGIKLALQNSMTGSTLFVITDASASDSNMYDEIRSMALKKQIQINFITTGDCKGRNDPGFQVFYKLAKDTVGEVFPILKSKVSDILEYVMESIISRRYLMAYDIIPSGQSHKVNYTVDNQIDDVIISITGLDMNKKVIRTTAPDGSNVQNSSIFRNEEIMIVRITKPQNGTYVTEINSDSETYVKVTGKSNINFQCGFTLVAPTSLIETATRPPAGGNSYLSIQLYAEGINLTTARVLDMNGNTLEKLSLRTPAEDNKFFVSKAFDPPRTLFRIAVDGYDVKTKTPISRKSAIPFERRNQKNEKIELMAPKVTIERWPKIITKYNVTYQLKCKAEGSTSLSIAWYDKNSGKMLSAKTWPIENPTEFISILNIGQPTKNASYECRVGNATQDIQVEVDKYFKVMQAPKGCINVEYEQEVSIFCKIDALPPATVIWYKDNSILTSDSNTEISNDNSSITIKQMNFETKGMYRCEVKHDLDSRVFNSSLILFGVAKPIITKTHRKLHVLNGNDMELICQIRNAVTPKPTINWSYSHQFGELFQEKNDTSNILYLKNVTGDRTGTYVCIASNFLGTDFYNIDLVVDYPPMSIKDDSPIIVKAGTVVSIPCNVYGVPSPKIEWFHNNSSIKTTSSIHVTTKNNLKFRNIQQDDAGNYTCVARNKYGSLEKTFKVEVYTPILIRGQEISAWSVLINQTLILTCEAYGYPTPEIDWLYNDFHGKLRMQRLRFDKMSKSYFILQLQLKDEGYYTCVARNKYDLARLTYEITVNAPPFITPFNSDKNFYAVEGDMTLKIHCVATGAPEPEIIWARHNLSIGLGNDEYDGENGSLVIKNISKTSQGDYSCWAKNKIGNYSSNVKVIVQDYPKPDVLNATKISANGTTLELQCSEEFKKTDTVRWFKDGNLLITDNKFELKNVSAKDSGIYSCRFSNITMSYSLHVDVIIQDQGVSTNHR